MPQPHAIRPVKTDEPIHDPFERFLDDDVSDRPPGWPEAIRTTGRRVAQLVEEEKPVEMDPDDPLTHDLDRLTGGRVVEGGHGHLEAARAGRTGRRPELKADP